MPGADLSAEEEGQVDRIAKVFRRRSAWTATAVAMLAGAVLASSASSQSTQASAKKIRIAYLSFAVANSYDAPMLAAAKAVAKKQGASVTVLDAANDPKKQFAQLQTVGTSKQYQGIIVQPIFGTGLIPVVNFVQTQIGLKQGRLVVQACAARNLNPCNIGYLYSVKVSSLDAAIRKGFNSQIAGHSSIKVVAEGETFYQPANALKAAQTMLQARPDINMIVGADQGATGAQQALGTKKVVLIGYGAGAVGLKAVRSGAWYGTVAQRPATEGRLAMQCVIKAVKTGKGCGGIDVLKNLPNGGVVTKANASKFKAEWPG